MWCVSNMQVAWKLNAILQTIVGKTLKNPASAQFLSLSLLIQYLYTVQIYDKWNGDLDKVKIMKKRSQVSG